MAASPETQSLKAPGIAAAIAATVAAFTPGGQPAAAAFFTTFAASYGLQAWSLREQRKASLQDVAERKTSIRSGQAPHRHVFGQCLTSGPLVYGQVTGAEKEYFHSILPLAAHACHSVGDLWIEDQRAPRDGTGHVNAGTYSGLVRALLHLGSDSQSADADLVAESGGQWTTNHRGRGHTYAYSRKKFDQDKLYALPNERYQVRGWECYDPRDGATRLTENPALLLRHYLCASWGLGATTAEIDDDLVGAAASVCEEWVALDAAVEINVTGDHANDEFTTATTEARLQTGDQVTLSASVVPSGLANGGVYWAIRTGPASFALAPSYQQAITGTRATFTSNGTGVSFNSLYQRRYTLNGSITLDQAPRDIVLDLLSAMAGNITWSAGKFRIYAGAYLAPDETRPITQADTRGPAVISPTRAHFDRTNQVRGSHPEPASFDSLTSYPSVGDPAYVTEDGGEVIERTADFPFTVSTYRAQRLAKIILNKSRAQRLTLPCKLRALRVATCETVRLDLPRYGLDGVYRVLGWRLAADTDGALGIDLQLEEETETQYEWTPSEATNPATPTPVDVPTVSTAVSAPASSAISSGNADLLTAADGTIISRMRVTWPAATSAGTTGYEIQWKRDTDTDYETTLIVGRDQLAAYLAPAEDGVLYQVRLRTIAAPGARRSAWLGNAHTVVGKTAAPSTPASAAASSVAGGILLTWAACPDADYKTTQVYEATANDWTHGSRTLVATVTGSTYLRAGLSPGDVRYFWVVYQDTSGNTSDRYPTTASGNAGIAGTAGAVTLGANAVDTVNVIANAITEVSSAFTAATTVLSAGTWTQVQSLAVAVTGEPLLVKSSCHCNVNAGGGAASAQIRLKRDSTVIAGPVTLTGYNNADGFLGLDAVDTPAAGTYTYSIEIFPSHGCGCDVRYVEVLETKR